MLPPIRLSDDWRRDLYGVRETAGTPRKTVRRELDRFCASYSLLDKLIGNSYLSDELKEVYRNMYLGRGTPI